MAKGVFNVVNMMLFACFAFALMSVYVMVNHEVSVSYMAPSTVAASTCVRGRGHERIHVI